jgi:hypothetical protein
VTDGPFLFSPGATVVLMVGAGLVLLALAAVLIAVGDPLTFGFVMGSGVVLEGLLGQGVWGRRALWAGIAAGATVLALGLAVALW